MAYGYKRKYSTRASSRASRFTKKRNSNQSVKRIQRKKYVPKVKKNTQSIFTLAKQVRNLQRSQIGLYQDRVEAATIDGSAWWDTKPLLFCANNFLDQTPIMTLANPDTSTPAIAIQTRFQLHSMGAPTMPAPYDFWAEHNDDKASWEAYLPISSTMEFRVKYMQRLETKSWETPVPEKVTIQVIKQKKQMMNSVEHRFVLPDALPGLSMIANRDMLVANKINPAYFEVVTSKTLNFLPTKYFPIGGSSTTQNQAIEMEKTCKIHLPFPNKVLKPDITRTSTSPAQTYGEFAMNVPVNEQYWVLINRHCDHTVVGNDKQCHIDISIRRTNRWRDQHGSTGH